ncbi:hypothetical protein B0H21DRAFT_177150 [Amylocystis lapponica]|nr:hypothetical protein B0H21DRAFT_177150 [Amylocystis lapponica]
MMIRTSHLSQSSVDEWGRGRSCILNDKYKPVTLQDDLESFFHVLLYYSIRFFASNCRNVAGFVEQFFDQVDSQNGVAVCGRTKTLAMVNGRVVVPTRLGYLHNLRLYYEESLQNHPLNTVVCELLAWFGAYYELDSLEKEEGRGPQDQRIEAAAQLSSHKAMCTLLLNCEIECLAMLQDKIPDRIGQNMKPSTPPSPNPTKRAGEADNTSGAPSAKRVQTSHGPDVEAQPPPALSVRRRPKTSKKRLARCHHGRAENDSCVKNVSGIWGLSSFAMLIVTSRMLYFLFNDA